LLVDDDLINQRVMVNLLRRRGWQATSVLSGQEALHRLDQEPFDLVLMDIQMPELDGYQTTARIREREIQQMQADSSPTATGENLGLPPPSRRLPIIALTTVSEPGTRDRCLKAGMDDYLAKPVKTGELYAMIARYLGLPA
jgi:CheY-like chemotaxis protein